jgi:hypothetical protein
MSSKIDKVAQRLIDIRENIDAAFRFAAGATPAILKVANF